MSGWFSAEFQEKRTSQDVGRLLEGGWGCDFPKTGGCDFPKQGGCDNCQKGLLTFQNRGL